MEDLASPRVIGREELARLVERVIPELACELPGDVLEAMRKARAVEHDERSRQVLDLLLENAAIAREDAVPICQDTGSVWVCLEVGPDVMVAGDVLADVDMAVARAYEAAHLRKSIVRDAVLDRANTGDNTPAFTELRLVERPGARVRVMLKGGGSDNASRVVMLAPGAGWDGVAEVVEACVREKAANACPPLVVGVGVGGTFDTVAKLAKHALLRPVGSENQDPEAAALEQDLLARVNATGIGPAALGGATTALAVHLETAPCHIAALPVAVNMGCSAMRRGCYEL